MLTMKQMAIAADGQVTERMSFLGLPFCNASAREVIENVQELSTSKSWTYIATPNAAHLVRIVKGGDEAAEPYRSASLLILDSRFVSVVAWALGLKTPTVLPGSDLTAELFASAIDSGARVCVIGSSAEAVRRLSERYQLPNISHYAPPMGFIKNSTEINKTLAFIVAARPNYTFLAVGSPQQEIVASLLSERGASGVGLCIGASIEFLTGSRPRAPKWMQSIGLEWLFRFACEPRRLFRRYFIESPEIFGILLRERLKR